MIHDALGNWQRYFDARPWKIAFEYLAQLNADSAVCDRVALDGDNIYAAIMEYPTKLPEDSILEAHNQHIDIQVSLKGAEGILWFPRNSLEVMQAYDEVRDFTLFHYPGKANAEIKNFPGYFTVLFPDDAHMPQQVIGDSVSHVKKAVVKLNKRLFPEMFAR